RPRGRISRVRWVVEDATFPADLSLQPRRTVPPPARTSRGALNAVTHVRHRATHHHARRPGVYGADGGRHRRPGSRGCPRPAAAGGGGGRDGPGRRRCPRGFAHLALAAVGTSAR